MRSLFITTPCLLLAVTFGKSSQIYANISTTCEPTTTRRERRGGGGGGEAVCGIMIFMQFCFVAKSSISIQCLLRFRLVFPIIYFYLKIFSVFFCLD